MRKHSVLFRTQILAYYVRPPIFFNPPVKQIRDPRMLTYEGEDPGVLPLRVDEELVHPGGVGGQPGQRQAVAARHLHQQQQ
jgi:hypothetical protein